jgi:Protein of unknown function (DUF3616)
MRSIFHARAACLLVLACVVLLPGFAAAQSEVVWRVKNKLVGKDDKKSENVSGIACVFNAGFPRPCMVIDDELQSAQLVTVNEGEIVAGPSIRLTDDQHDGKALELDGEGVAYANGFFYVIGSHGHPRDKAKKLNPVADADKISAKIAASSQLIRIRVDPVKGHPVAVTGAASDVPEIARTARLKEVMRADPVLAPFVDKRLESNGATIEGIAVRGDRLFAGFRGPVVNGDRAVILSVAVAALFGAEPADAKLHLLPLKKGRGVRDLAALPDGLLVLAGPMADTGGGTYSIYWWDGATDTPKLLKDLPTYTEDGENLKPEAILPLNQTSAGLRVLILLDGAKEGGPRAIEVARP